MTPHEMRAEMLLLAPDGRLVSSWPIDAEQPHGLTLIPEADGEYVWVADSASARVREANGTYGRSRPSNPARGSASRYSLAGEKVLTLPMPDHEAYVAGDYRPTQVATQGTASGGSGDIWVADGYGQHFVHRFDAAGKYLMTLTGDEGVGRFNQPHCVYIDDRRSSAELWVGDRKNRRVQIFDLEGRFLRSFGEDYLLSPSCFAAWGPTEMVIAELDGRLTFVQPDGTFIAHLGKNRDSTRDRPGWPNAIEDGNMVGPPVIPGEFVAPHGIAVDEQLNLYVTEFLIGGRLVRLDHVDARV